VAVDAVEDQVERGLVGQGGGLQLAPGLLVEAARGRVVRDEFAEGFFRSLLCGGGEMEKESGDEGAGGLGREAAFEQPVVDGSHDAEAGAHSAKLPR
jgi:hypothetical protein